jgi:hypothetical protein
MEAEKGKDVQITTRTAESTFSGISKTATLLESTNFHPGTTLQIQQAGIGVWRFPLPCSELVTEVLHEDGSIAYTSTRARKSSGSAVLSHFKMGDLMSTTYTWGPRRPPVLKYLQGQDGADTVQVTNKCMSRTTSFTTPDGRAYDWCYACMKDENGKKVNLIALRERENNKILAQLIRGVHTRTEGTSTCTAGNGGQLVLDQDAASYLEEATIVATCLMMLKKEIDRRRAMQMVAIACVVTSAC